MVSLVTWFQVFVFCCIGILPKCGTGFQMHCPEKIYVITQYSGSAIVSQRVLQYMKYHHMAVIQQAGRLSDITRGLLYRATVACKLFLFCSLPAGVVRWSESLWAFATYHAQCMMHYGVKSVRRGSERPCWQDRKLSCRSLVKSRRGWAWRNSSLPWLIVTLSAETRHESVW